MRLRKWLLNWNPRLLNQKRGLPLKPWLRRSLPLLLVGLTGCSLLAQIGVPVVRPIAQVQAEPQVGRTVHIEGTVVDRVPLINQQIYQLQDHSGKIWVLTNQTSLRTGDRVRVRGKVRFQSISIAGQELGEVYIEAQS
jgi:hypothetical protein